MTIELISQSFYFLIHFDNIIKYNTTIIDFYKCEIYDTNFQLLFTIDSKNEEKNYYFYFKSGFIKNDGFYFGKIKNGKNECVERFSFFTTRPNLYSFGDKGSMILRHSLNFIIKFEYQIEPHIICDLVVDGIQEQREKIPNLYQNVIYKNLYFEDWNNQDGLCFLDFFDYDDFKYQTITPISLKLCQHFDDLPEENDNIDIDLIPKKYYFQDNLNVKGFLNVDTFRGNLKTFYWNFTAYGYVLDTDGYLIVYFFFQNSNSLKRIGHYTNSFYQSQIGWSDIIFVHFNDLYEKNYTILFQTQLSFYPKYFYHTRYFQILNQNDLTKINQKTGEITIDTSNQNDVIQNFPLYIQYQLRDDYQIRTFKTNVYIVSFCFANFYKTKKSRFLIQPIQNFDIKIIQIQSDCNVKIINNSLLYVELNQNQQVCQVEIEYVNQIQLTQKIKIYKC